MRSTFGQIRPLLALFSALSPLGGQSNSLDERAHTILATKCLSCHGDVRMADLDLRQSTTILKGGKRGPAVVPGNAEASLLFKAVKREGDVQMPPGKSSLTTAEVSTLRDWINAGARMPVSAKAGTTGPAAPSWWS
ncbi:MAG TPA: c-type cytochrome domain-containing protein, partial [Bryobacteraceae bacterium]|nr:c-type cytochrome domain-containing protein [Bryobacteraceae bacterium]